MLTAMDFLIVVARIMKTRSIFTIPEDCESGCNADKDSSAKSLINLRNRRGN